MVYHKADFNLDVAWVFLANGHGKGASDGVGAIIKSTVRCVTLVNNILLSNPYDFYEFCKNHQLETTWAAGRHQPTIDVFFFNEKELQRTKRSVLEKRQNQLRSKVI